MLNSNGHLPGADFTGESTVREKNVLWQLAAFLLFFALQGFLTDYIVDDAFIHLTFARNIATGHGFSFNPDQPTYGVTAPLWTLLFALFSLMFTTGPGMAKAFSIIFGALTIPFFRVFAGRVGLSPGFANLATLVWAANVWLARWSASGMEASLAVLLLLLAFDAHLEGRSALTGLWIGLAILTRPETAGLAVIFFIDNYRLRGIRHGIRFLIVSTLIVLPWLCYALFTFGTIIPNPALIKSDALFPPLSDVLYGLKRVAFILGGAHGIELILAASIAIIALRRRRMEIPDYWLAGILALWAVFPAAFYVSRGVFVQSRYLLIGMPPLILGGFLALKYLTFHRNEKGRRSVLYLVASVLIVQQLFLTRFITIPHVEAFKPSLQALIRLAERVRLESNPEALIAVGDVGAVGFYSERRILDIEGLVSAEIIPHRLGMTLDDFILNGRFLLASSPDYLIDKSLDSNRLAGRFGSEMVVTYAVPGGLIESADQNWYYTLYKLNKARY